MIRPIQLHELRARGGAVIAAAAAETGSPGAVQWPQLEMLHAAGALVLLVVEVDGNLVGHCCAAVGGEFWSPEVSCTTLSVFVRPEHRGRWGWPLLLALARAAEEHSADLLRVQVIPGSRLERLVRLLGFTPRAVAYDAPVMQYIACHGRRLRHHRSSSSRLRGLRGREAGRGIQDGPAPAGEGPEGR